MALSTRKINQIKAEWKAGKYKTAYAIAKAHNIDRKTADKIIEGISQSNADIVEVCVIAENAKNSLKNPVELKVIEAMVKERTIADEIQDIVLSGTLANLKSVKSKIEKEEVETMQDHRHAQELFDKALITAGKADRHAPKTEIVNTNAQQNNIEAPKIIFKRIGNVGDN